MAKKAKEKVPAKGGYVESTKELAAHCAAEVVHADEAWKAVYRDVAARLLRHLCSAGIPAERRKDALTHWRASFVAGLVRHKPDLKPMTAKRLAANFSTIGLVAILDESRVPTVLAAPGFAAMYQAARTIKQELAKKGKQTVVRMLQDKAFQKILERLKGRLKPEQIGQLLDFCLAEIQARLHPADRVDFSSRSMKLLDFARESMERAWKDKGAVENAAPQAVVAEQKLAA